MKTIIMAGGKGSRISELFPDIPKPLIPVDGMPILERELYCLRNQGFDDIIITVSYLGDKIISYFGDGAKISPVTGKSFGVHLEYFIEEKPLGNAGALFEFTDKLTDDFFLLNADTAFDVDFGRFLDYHISKGAEATLFTHPNDHPYDSGLIVADTERRVMQWLTREDTRPAEYKNRVNAGLHVLKKSLFKDRPVTEKVDLDRQILKPLAGSGRLFCYDSSEYVKDMGTPERYEAVCRDFRSGLVNSKNLKNKQKAVFLDRDGTINRYVGFLRKMEEFELLPGVADAIRTINRSGYLVIVVTNQPVIARGEVTQETLSQIHDRMETLLGKEGAYIDGLYYCPHHPDSGFAGEIKELKIDCSCRKPKPGMLLKAAEEFNIDLSGSWMIGDGKRDIEAGKAAGCKTVLLGDEDFGQDASYDDLAGFTKAVFSDMEA